MKKLFAINMLFASICAPNCAFAQIALPPANFLENPNGLVVFNESLKSSKESNTPVHIIYIGDSHTAADFITGAMRDDLSAKFGNAGRGFFAAGMPYYGFNPRGINIENAKNWQMRNSFPFSKSDAGPFALSGYRARINGNLPYKINSPIEIDNFAACGISTGANLLINNDVILPFKNNLNTIKCQKIKFNQPSSQIEISKSKSGDIGLSMMGIWREQSGIVLSSFGIPGSSLNDFARRDIASIANEIAILPPNLIVLAYGTNEGFEKDFDSEKYRNILKNKIIELKTAAPNASILIIGAPDAGRKANGASGTSCNSLNPQLSEIYPNISASELGASYYSPPNLANVRMIQKQVAFEMNAGFWDWHEAMGGDCSAANLSLLPEREIMGDRVHFSKIGAQKIGSLLAQNLINAYINAYKISDESGAN